MKKVYVNEKWCLGCHLCEYYCAFSKSDASTMVKALKDKKINSMVHVEGDNHISFAVSCRHCEEPLCIKSCLTGALHKENGIVTVDKEKCISCFTCITACPYGAIVPNDENPVLKCDLCVSKSDKTPSCVLACPNNALEFKEKEE